MNHIDPALGSSMRLNSTIFHESWWMEIAGEGAQQEVCVHTNGMVVARLPFIVYKRYFAMRVLGMPPMAHVLGPALSLEFLGSGLRQTLKQYSLIRDLIVQLPKAAYTSFRLHAGVMNTLAFNAAGFSTRVDFTVEIQPDSEDVLWRQMRDKTRNVVRRAQEQLTVLENQSAAEFLDFYEENLQKLGARNHYDRSVCEKIITECLKRDCGGLLLAVDQHGSPQAAIFTVWDHHMEYYFMSTRTPNSMNGAVSLLIWQAILHAARYGLVFDMDLLHVTKNMPNLGLLTGFGGEITPRYFVQRMSPVIQITRGVRDLIR